MSEKSEYTLEYDRDELFQKIHNYIQASHGFEETKLASMHYAQIKSGKRDVSERILKKYNVNYRKISHPRAQAEDC